MNAGVCTMPCGVVSTPRRARPSVCVTLKAKDEDDIAQEQFTIDRDKSSPPRMIADTLATTEDTVDRRII
jgi:hypothetical protein